MPRQSRTRSKKEYKWLGHIEVSFNDEGIKECLAYVGERNWDFEDVISVITQQNTALKFSYEQGTSSYRITIQPKEYDCYLRGYTLGYSHTDLARLLQIASYIVTEMIEHQAIELPGKESANDW